MAEAQATTDLLKSDGYTVLDPDKIVITIEALERRIGERFPESGLRVVCRQLLAVGRQARRRTIEISRPITSVRFAAGALIAVGGAALLYGLFAAEESERKFTIWLFLEAMDWAISDLVYMGLGIIFLITLEGRIKRRKALQAIHELRSIAHIIDMHQLTKDPDQVLHPGHDTKSSPKRTLTATELPRYLDYCSEMLSLVGKIAALYVQRFDDSVALAAVNEVESVTTGLSRKIWQKVMIIEGVRGEPGGASRGIDVEGLS